MDEKFKDILSNLSTEVDQETLLLYLQGKLSEEKKHEVEKTLAANEFACMEAARKIAVDLPASPGLWRNRELIQLW